jgi:steroid delta-isomerase-like uncharacterized protein
MSIEANKALIRRLYDEGFNKGRVELADEIIAADFVDQGAAPGLPSTGPESFKQTLQVFRTAFPDMHATIEDMIAEGDKVAMRCRWHGTHLGEFFGAPATGRSFTLTSTDVLRIERGKIAEHWGNEDDLGMLRQLGILSELAEIG